MPAVAEKAITNGALLVKKLAATGTGEGKLAPLRKKLAEVHRSEQGRVATADEMVAVLHEIEAPAGTLLKAKTLIDTGVWHGPPNEVEVPIEVKLLGEEAVSEWQEERKHELPAGAVGFSATEPKDGNTPGVYASPVDPAFRSEVGPKPAGRGRKAA